MRVILFVWVEVFATGTSFPVTGCNSILFSVIVSEPRIISTPDPARIKAQINPGIRYIALDKEWDLPSGISLTVLIISIRKDP